jgi:membrane-bound ClpP family serine protease
MKTTAIVIGVILIILGALSLGYNGFSYTSKEKIAQVGTLQVSADTEKEVFIPPIVGVISLVAGIVLLVVGARAK